MSELVRLATREAGAALEAVRGLGTDAAGIAEHLTQNSWLARRIVSQDSVGIVDKLRIAEPDLTPGLGLMLPSKTTVKNLLRRNSYAGPFSSIGEYRERCLDLVPTTVRVSKVPGADISITTPEWFAAAIDTRNPTWQGMLAPGLIGPRDIPRLLDEMPNKTYFKRVFVSDRPDPYQDWNSYVTGKPFLSEMSMDSGEFRTFGTRHYPYLRTDGLHEWSHQLRFRYWDDPLAYRFFEANFFEQPEWSPSVYSRRSTDEMWAVLGERYLGTNTMDFLQATEKAPIRSVVWMDALGKSLQEVPLASRSTHHQEYLDRVKYVNDFVVDPALEKVWGYSKTPGFDQVKAKALMQYLQKQEQKQRQQLFSRVLRPS